MSKIGTYLLARPMRANLAALVFVLMPLPIPGTGIAAIILALVTLQRGIAQGLVVLAWIALPAIAALLKWQLIAAHYELSFLACAMTWFVAMVLRQSRGCWAKAAELAALLGFFYIALLYVIPEAWLLYLENGLQQATVGALRQLVSIDSITINNLVHSKIFFLMGAFYFAVSVLAISYVVVARVWQLKLVDRAQKSLEFCGVQSCRMTGILAFLTFAAAIVWGGDVFETAALIVALPLLVGGLSVALYGCLRMTESKVLKVVMVSVLLMMLAILPAISCAILALLGFIDIWVNFRKLRWLPSSPRVSSGQVSK